MFGKQVDDIAFINGLMVVYFSDGNQLTIDFWSKQTSFKDPLEFMKWLETKDGSEKRDDVKVAA